MNKMIVIFILTILSLSVAQEAQNKTLPKPFGVGIGPVYIGGRDTDLEGTKLSLIIYKQYIQYKRLLQQSLQDDEQYYAKWTNQNQCIGACPQYSYCRQGICICDHTQSVTQIYGRCFSNFTASFVGNKEKYRKPTPPPRPDWCFCKTSKDSKKVCDEFSHREECHTPTYPDNFDHNSQMCKPGDHQHCLTKDINMYCSEKTLFDPTDGIQKHVCQCRKDMDFDTRNMECRIYLKADCTYANKDPSLLQSTLVKLMTGQADEPDREYTPDEIRDGFCNLLDSHADEYNAHIIGEFNFTFLGLGIGGLLLVAFVTCCTACCCCKCCNKVKEKIRRLDPRNAMREAGMGQGAQMAALGAVAAGEYMENRNEKQDEARIAAMQGQSLGMPGGAPAGYAPVPTGYPNAGPGYPQYQPGYAPVPTGYPEGPGYPPQQPGYPPQQPGYPQPGYPPQQPGYIPPADGGPGLMNMAPELALAGAGAFTGNAAMTGMGVVAAAERMDGMEDKEDALRAAALKGMPPPPMGYAGGGQPTYPPQNNLPPASANYPRM